MTRFATHFGRFIIGGVLFALMVSAAQAQKAADPNAAAPVPAKAGATDSVPSSANKVVLKIGGEQLTQAELEELFTTATGQRRAAAPPAMFRSFVEKYAEAVVLARKAVEEHLDNSPEVRRQLEIARVSALAKAEYGSLAASQPDPKPEEINRYYSDHKKDFEEVRIRNVAIRKKPEKVKGLSAQDAKARADDIRKALAAGTDPKKVVEQYKMGADIISISQRSVYRQPPEGGEPDEDEGAFAMKDGEFTPNREDVPDFLAFTQVLRHGYRDVKDVAPAIKVRFRKEKVSAAVADMKKKSNIWMDEASFPASPPPSKGPGAMVPGQMNAPGAGAPAGVKVPPTAPEKH